MRVGEFLTKDGILNFRTTNGIKSIAKMNKIHFDSCGFPPLKLVRDYIIRKCKIFILELNVQGKGIYCAA